MSSADGIFTLGAVCVIPWLLSAWFRLPRYARLFQLKNYDYKRYFLWLSNTKAENRYCLASAIILALSPVVFCGGFFFLHPIVSVMLDKPFLAGIAYFGLLLIALCFSPRKNLGGQKSRFTPRVVRLISVAFFVELVPIFIGTSLIQYAYDAVSDPRNSPESMGILAAPFILFIMLVAIVIGPIAFVITPYTIPLANLVNWPIDLVLAKVKPRI